MAVTRFNIAIDRPKKDGKENGTDYPNIVVFGKTAENVCRYMDKGRLIAVLGKITTGSYKAKDGKTVYTTDVVADRIEFLERIEKPVEKPIEKPVEKEEEPDYYGFSYTGDGMPF